LQAALAADTPSAAKPVMKFLKRSRLEDVRLEALLRGLNVAAHS
jgi:hypothetical protein